MDDFESNRVAKLRRSKHYCHARECLTTENVRVLDYGYVRLTDAWGRAEIDDEVSDKVVVVAARMSTDKGFLGWGVEENCERCRGKGEHGPWADSSHDSDQISICTLCKGTGKHVNKPGDEKLLRFLWENRHATPFEMAGITIESQSPIMVFREWHRHRIPFGYSELSARYSPLPDMHYVPTVERMLINSKTNKQAGTIKDADELTPEVAAALIEEEIAFNVAAERFYQKKLKAGVPKELARTHLGVSRYSRMRATGNLRGWLAFLTLREAPSAQWEIRQYAHEVGRIIARLFPRTHALFAEGR